jgi:hypothetical protein
MHAPPGDNPEVPKNLSRNDLPRMNLTAGDANANSRRPFQPGSLVIVTLNNPREKFWGMILALAPEGLSLTGVELASFEDLIVMVKDGDPFTPAVVFFPMHRIERVELDLPDGGLPSLSQRFREKTGLEPSNALARTEADEADAARSRERA